MPPTDKIPRVMHDTEKQRIRAKNKRAPTLVEKARELLRLSGVKTTLIINEDLEFFSNGKVHMYTNEARPIVEVLEGYLHHIKTKSPYYLMNHNAPDATFLKKHVKKRKNCSGDTSVSIRFENEEDLLSGKTVGGVKVSDVEIDEGDELFDDLNENTEIYKKGTCGLGSDP